MLDWHGTVAGLAAGSWTLIKNIRDSKAAGQRAAGQRRSTSCASSNGLPSSSQRRWAPLHRPELRI
eukprot:9492166-Pyramimonas_sp.AAC.1